MNNLIRRQDAIEAIIAEGRDVDSRYLDSERIIHESDAVEAIAMLPSAQPETEERTAESSQKVPKEDLISRKTAIDAIEKESQVDGAYGYMDTKSIVDLLNDLPSAEPEIIRCKYCKHRYTDECSMRYTEWVERDEYGEYDLRDIVHDYTEDEKFCSEGERRANDTD